MKKHIVLALLITGYWSLITSSTAQVPQLVNYQGRLLDGTGLVNGSVALSLRLYNVSVGGTILYEDSNSVTVVDGLYSTFLGDNTTTGSLIDALTNATVYIETVVNGAALTPREQLASVAYALAVRGIRVDTNLPANVTFNPNMNVISNGNIGASVLGGGRNDIRSGSPFSVVGGGSNNNVAAASSFATIAGGLNNDVSSNADSSAIGGGDNNDVGDNSSYSTIAGGIANEIGINSDNATISGGANGDIGANSRDSAIGGGFDNDIGDNTRYSTIAGGNGNDIGTNSDASAIGGGFHNNVAANSGSATIAGGFENDIGTNAGFSAISGGVSNNVAANSGSSTIGGGTENDIGTNSAYSSIGGGIQNNVSNNTPHATIAGGESNEIGEKTDHAAIGGGHNNTIDFEADGSFIGGGLVNSIQPFAGASFIGGGGANSINRDATYSSLGGGYANSIGTNANYSVIPGGLDNTVGKDASYAFAAGRRAQALHRGSFVWADAQSFDFASTTTNGFFVRATGGAKFVTAIDGGGDEAAGVRVIAGSSAWTTLSDRNSKTNFATVDTQELLNRLAAIPILTWNWKAQDAGTRHMGPMAQDFYAAFDVGEDEHHITTVDADGVALAAIQGLYQLVKEQQKRIEELEKHRSAP